MDRRNFVKLSSILTAGSTMLTGCGKGLRETMPLAVPEQQRVLGEETWVKSVCGGCGASCGVEVRLVDGRAVKMEGLPGHPVNAGRLCARGQAELQALYNPDRIRAPRIGKQDAHWDQALDTAAAKLREANGAIVLITPRLTGLRAQIAADFAKALGATQLISEPLDQSAILEANRLTCGYASHAVPDYGNSNYVLSFSAPLVEGGPSPVRTQRLLAHMRQGRPGRRGKLVQADARFSLTAAYADEWLPLTPGTEGQLALAIAHVLLRDSLVGKEFASGKFADLAKAHPPEGVAAVTGIDAKRIERIAHEFAANQPAIAVAGGAAAGYAGSVQAIAAINALNALVGSYGVPGGIWFEKDTGAGGTPALHSQTFQSAKVVIVYGANPVYEYPQMPWDRVPFPISLSAFPDETATAAHLVLPDDTALERWESRGISVAKPVMKPLYDTRDAADTLIALAAKAGKALPYESWQKAIAASFKSEDELSAALERGWTEPAMLAPKKFEFMTEPPPSKPAPAAFAMQVYAGVSLGAGDRANLPWLQELPDPLSQSVWTTLAEMNPKTAAKLSLADGDKIWLESARGKIQARVAISPAAPPNGVIVAAGQGHSAYGRYAQSRGGNVYSMIDPANWAITEVKLSRA